MQSSCLSPIRPTDKTAENSRDNEFAESGPKFLFSLCFLSHEPVTHEPAGKALCCTPDGVQLSGVVSRPPPHPPRYLLVALQPFPLPNIVLIVLKTGHKSNPKQRFLPLFGREVPRAL